MAYGSISPTSSAARRAMLIAFLKGGPGDAPYQEPAKFELVLNEKAAVRWVLALSPTLLAGADQVIE